MKGQLKSFNCSHPINTRFVFLTSFVVLVLFSFFPVSDISAVEETGIQFFYSTSCPHCYTEQLFLDVLEEKYPDIVIERLPIDDAKNQRILRPQLEAAGAIEYFGAVPITFVGTKIFIGFDDAQHMGADIEAAVLKLLGERPSISPSELDNLSIQSSAVSRYNLNGLPLPVAAVVLGFLDGFNVCSLGALALILGLVLVMRNRRRVILLGSAFIGTTALIYGALIIFWYRLFSVLGAYIGTMQILIGLAAAIAGAYFLHQFWRFRHYGPTCSYAGGTVVRTITERVQRVLGGGSGIIAAILAVFLFAGVITIVEFPCSAAVPLVFAGMLADSGASIFMSIVLIALFVLLYLLDELIVFGIAISRLRLWLASPSVTTWAVLVEGIILLSIGVWYLSGAI